MAQNSTIEWTEATWNPVTGCSKISPGCKNCYAERFRSTHRLIVRLLSCDPQSFAGRSAATYALQLFFFAVPLLPAAAWYKGINATTDRPG